jgi:hypothetical protein
MKSSWETKAEHFEWRWSELAPRSKYKARWMQEARYVEGSHLPSLPDHGHHSPFGGAAWFTWYTYLSRESL